MKNKVKMIGNCSNLLDRIANILVEARTKVVREIKMRLNSVIKRAQ